MESYEAWLYTALSAFYERTSSVLRQTLVSRSGAVIEASLSRLNVLLLKEEQPASEGSSLSSVESLSDEMQAVRRALKPTQKTPSSRVSCSSAARALRALVQELPESHTSSSSDLDEAKRKFPVLADDEARFALLSQYHVLLSDSTRLQLAMASFVADRVTKRLLDLQRLSRHPWLTGVESEAMVARADARARALTMSFSGRDLAVRLLTAVLEDAALAAAVVDRDLARTLPASLSVSGSHVRHVLGLLDAWSATSPSTEHTPSAAVLASTLSETQRISEGAKKLLRQRSTSGTESPDLRASVRASVERQQREQRSVAEEPSPAFAAARRKWHQRRSRIDEAWIEREQQRLTERVESVESQRFDVFLQARSSLRERHATILGAVDAAIASTVQELAGSYGEWMQREGVVLRQVQDRLQVLSDEARRYGPEMEKAVEFVQTSCRARAMSTVRSIALSTSDALTQALQTWC